MTTARTDSPIPLPDRRQSSHTSGETWRTLLVACAASGLVVGLAHYLAAATVWADAVWAAATLPVLAALVAEIVHSLRRGEVGLDIVAALSMTGALAVGEELAAVVIALMYTGGQFLESFAARQARREMTALLARAPRSAARMRDGMLEEVTLDLIAAGDRLLVRRGDVVPVDGTIAAGVAVLDQSALTGEAMPVRLGAGDAVLSGASNVSEAFELIATRAAADSTYAGIVRLVEAARDSKAPMTRLADRYALAFLAATVLIAGLAFILTRDPIRVVAVLVIATPCPLILAVPVALVSGLSRAARHGILIKGGKALESLWGVRSLVIDKTGTLTGGRARLVAIRPHGPFSPDEILVLAASLDQASKHVIAQTLVEEARARNLPLSLPMGVKETPGEGVEGCVAGKKVVVGGRRFVARKLAPGASVGTADMPGAVLVGVASDHELIGELVLADELRTGTGALLERLRGMGIERILLATGDRRDVADAVAAGLNIDAVRADLTPDQKIMVVLAERKYGPVMMIGDGINDAPALAAADVGVAMGAKGAAASAEAADVVLLVDRLDRIAPAIEIARRSRAIALQSVYVGIGLSFAGMLAAALGHLTPVQGALLQEAIDVAVIVNALRALGGTPASI